MYYSCAIQLYLNFFFFFAQSQQTFPDGTNGDLTVEADLRSSASRNVSTDIYSTHTLLLSLFIFYPHPTTPSAPYTHICPFVHLSMCNMQASWFIMEERMPRVNKNSRRSECENLGSSYNPFNMTSMVRQCFACYIVLYVSKCFPGS